jgi:hypothetical protein
MNGSKSFGPEIKAAYGLQAGPIQSNPLWYSYVASTKLRDAAGYWPSSSSLSLIFAEEKLSYRKVAHPLPDSIYQLHVMLTATGEDCKAELIHHS